MPPTIPQHTRRLSRGMTLIELIVAIALLALITLIAYRGLSTLERSTGQLTQESERWQDIALFFARFGNDVTQPAVRPIHTGSPQSETQPASTPVRPDTARSSTPTTQTAVNTVAIMTQSLMMTLGGYADVSNAPALPAWQGRNLPTLEANDTSSQATLEFTRKSVTGRDETRMGYRLRGTRLELLIWPALDRAPHTVPAIYPLLDEVTALRLRYLDATGLWQEYWPPNDDRNSLYLLPLGVEISLTLRDGTRLTRIFALPS